MTPEIDVVGWDLDSTVFDTSHRRLYIDKIRAGEGTWLEYSLLCAGDTPIPGVIDVMTLLSKTTRQIAISGRNMCALDLTWKSIRQYGIPLDEVILRPDEDLTENGEFKVRMLRKLEGAGMAVKLFMEDWPPTADYIRSAGFPVLVLNPCYPATAGDTVAANV
jgi:hypothetical protein